MRHEHFIKQHMLNIRNGIKVSFTVPTETTYHKPTVPPRYTPVLQSRGNRKPSVKSPFNWRGAQPSLDGERVMHFESSIELKAGRILRADRNVVELREQWPTVKYLGADGKMHKHTFDFWLRLKCGKRISVAAKPKDIVVSSGLLDILRRIYRMGVADYADSISLVTEAFANAAANANAEWILLSRRNRNEEEYQAAREFVAGMSGPMRFWDMLIVTPLVAYRRTAIWNLIDEGVLQPVEAGRITDASLLVKGN
ncbi:hypothetical protein [Sinorhizobium terangae]|uniref:hypothetical protein n=1 Tax=Sinorhizobium terangae TaxID=110322 RepID=UPI0024B22A54|nr:hypothetical protein [Sinorhizobium terangae]WFU49174.1 hypothetical protein QA637_07185 [Sinorhizobium terangae]